MTIVRWDPTRELGSLQQQVNQVFSTFFDPASTGATGRWAPAVDLIEREDVFLLVADLPGVDPADVSIEVEGDVLTLAGKRDVRHGTQKGGFVRAERAAGAFRRQLTLPDGVDADAIEAHFDAGVLEVRVPKPEAAKPRRVSIRVGDRAEQIEATARDASSSPATEREPVGA